MSRKFIATIALLPFLAACVGDTGTWDLDWRANGISNATTAAQTAPRPEPDANGLITYPTYQVVLAQRGDTVADVATRVGIPVEELASFNGRSPADSLRAEEVLALPRRVTPQFSGTTGTNDIASIASAAIDRAEPSNTSITTTTLEVQDGAEPVRHRVARGETAYSISRLYSISVRSLADWNGLGPDLTVREGQFLLIPLVLEDAEPLQDSGLPGNSTTPVPPSASDPLPEPIETAVLPSPQNTTPTPAAPVSSTPTAASRMQRPVSGDIIRTFSSRNEGIDIAAAAGEAVRAAADGEVAAITQDTDQVPILVLRHPDNLLTVYAGIQDIQVARGDRISRGQTVASVGQGDPSFLHFEVRRGFEAIDPVPFIQ